MSSEYDLWNDPDICLDECCIIDGQGDPDPVEPEFPQSPPYEIREPD